MFDNNDSIEEQRRKHFESLNIEDSTPNRAPFEKTEPINFETVSFTSNESSRGYSQPTVEAQPPVKKQRVFLPALFGAIVGALLTMLVFFGIYQFTDIFKPATISSIDNGNSGTVINFEGGQAESQVEAVAQVVPKSVVGISAEVVTSGTNVFGQPVEQQGTSIGSGFFVTDNGYIVTNQHVVTDNPSKITISTADEQEYDGKLIWSDADLDMAIVKVDATGTQALSLGNSDDLTVGSTVVAVGNPLGLNYSRTVTAGIISAIDRTLVEPTTNKIAAEGLIQTDAAINQGNSGGPLVNTKGEVIGINTYKSAQGEGIGFAIPINLFKPIIQEVIETGNFVPRLIGVTGYDPEQAKYILNNQIENFTSGFYVVSVQDGSPAQKAGLQEGDIIKSVDGKDINTLIQMRTILYNHKIGETIDMTYERGGQTHEAKLTLSGN